MASSVDTLKGALGIGAKKYKFKVSLPFPGLDNADILCKTVSVPAITLGETEVFSKGRKLKIRGHRKFEGDFKCTFLSDDAHTLRKAMEDYVEKIDSFTTNIAAINNDYMNQEVTVTQLDGADGEKAKWKFYNVWPKEIGEIEFTSEESEDLIELTVSFAYSHFERIQ